MSLQEPHILLASNNANKLLENIRYVLDQNAYNAIQEEINRNVKLLFELGESHYEFAKTVNGRHWRQKISRLYYAAYNVRRAVNLHTDGRYNTGIEDHKRSQLPHGLENAEIYQNKIRTLRDDRNLSDYDHLAQEPDLVDSPEEAEELVENFIRDAKTYLISRGVNLE